MEKMSIEIEISPEEWECFRGIAAICEHIEVLNYFTLNEKKFVEIARFFSKTPERLVRALEINEKIEEFEILEKKSDMVTVYIRYNSKRFSFACLFKIIDLGEYELFTEDPIEFFENRTILRIVGEKKNLARFKKFINKSFRTRILRVERYIPHKSSILLSFTPKQRETLLKAYEMGYYTIPRKTTLSEIGKAMNISDSAVREHLRKSENKIMSLIFGKD
ncbi:MAG: helix-turn-helix domain-containing protein [Methanomicrobia archaeon]|nr:helix-turn-helix domain-containing protein [Methanomicrobia archaeon]